MPAREPEQWTEILSAHPEEVADLARRLRKAALAALPDLTAGRNLPEASSRRPDRDDLRA